MINNVNTNLMQLEWIKKELKWISYELNKFLKLFLYKKSFSILFYSVCLFIGLHAVLPGSSGFILQVLGPQCNDLINSLDYGLITTNTRGSFVKLPSRKGIVDHGPLDLYRASRLNRRGVQFIDP
jgi:hypothetical protein